MAKRSSRKSSSGDEALLWGIAAVVVAVAGVGTAIMLTRRGKPAIGNTETHTCTNLTKDGQSKKFTCQGGAPGCVDDSPVHCNPVKPVQTDTYCYRALRQGVGKDVKYFVQKEKNKNENGACPQGWLAQSNAGLKAGTYQTIEVSDKNQCYNNYLMPTNYTTANCLQAGDCDTTSFTDSACKTQWTPPSCRRGPGFSNCEIMRCSDATDSYSCNVGTDPINGQACCVWGQEPPKPPAPDNAKKKKYQKPAGKCCGPSEGCPGLSEDQCNVEQINGVKCYWDPTGKCKKKPAGKCCGPSEGCPGLSEDQCNVEQINGVKCYWDETGQCNTENFRMRRWRR